MADFDILADLMNSENVVLSIANTIGPGQTDFLELIAIYDVQEIIDNPTTRRNTRSGPIDFFAAAILEFECTSTVSKKVRDRIRSLSKQNSRNALQIQSFQVVGSSIGGANDTTYSFDCQVTRYRGSSPPIGDWVITFKLRILNATFT